MRKFFVGLAVIGVITIVATFADASCVCTCINGQYQPGCTSEFDIPPICAVRPCPFSSSPKTLPLGGRAACVQAQSCDIYGHCEWKLVCR